MNTLWMGWTTFCSYEEAAGFAKQLIEKKLAICVEIEGPITAFYRWEQALTKSIEYRLTIKFLSKNSKALQSFIESNHPYDTPQWLALPISLTTPKYFNWAQEFAE